MNYFLLGDPPPDFTMSSGDPAGFGTLNAQGTNSDHFGFFSAYSQARFLEDSSCDSTISSESSGVRDTNQSSEKKLIPTPSWDTGQQEQHKRDTLPNSSLIARLTELAVPIDSDSRNERVAKFRSTFAAITSMMQAEFSNAYILHRFVSAALSPLWNYQVELYSAQKFICCIPKEQMVGFFSFNILFEVEPSTPGSSIPHVLPHEDGHSANDKLVRVQKTVFQSEGDLITQLQKQKQSPEKDWENNLRQLRTFKNENNHCSVFETKSSQGKRVVQWNEMCEKLKAYKEGEGNCLVPARFVDSDGSWVQKQRSNYKKGHLSDSQVQQLESIGFVFEILSCFRAMQWNV